MIGVVVLITVLAIWLVYTTWLKYGVRPRLFHTTLPADQVRAAFIDKVARTGWRVVDDGNPLVAQSPLVTGVRQQIALHIHAVRGALVVDARPLRMQMKVISQTPTKGHTLRVRMNSFVKEVRRLDPGMQLVER